MNKLDTELQLLTITRASPPDPAPARRFLVPVTSPEADPAFVTQRIWELAHASGARIQFIGLCADPLQEPGLRRALVTMAAMMNNDNVAAGMEILLGRDFLGSLKSRLQTGDMVVCLDRQQTGLLQKPLNQVLQSDPDLPLYILSGLPLERRSSPGWLAQAAAWVGSLVIIAGFFTVQVKVDRLAQDWTIALQILTTAVEFWLLWAWNALLK